MEPELIATIEDFHTEYINEPVDIYKSYYMSEPVVALMVCAQGTHEVLAKVTVNLSGYGTFPAEGNVFIKDYEENEGIRQALEDAEVLGPPLSHHPTGFAVVTEHKLLL